jgi:hypothetical protein
VATYRPTLLLNLFSGLGVLVTLVAALTLVPVPGVVGLCGFGSRGGVGGGLCLLRRLGRRFRRLPGVGGCRGLGLVAAVAFAVAVLLVAVVGAGRSRVGLWGLFLRLGRGLRSCVRLRLLLLLYHNKRTEHEAHTQLERRTHTLRMKQTNNENDADTRL